MSKKQRRSALSEDEDEGSLLPEDVIVSEILVKLAIKPLFKFKCVSKRYNSIISDPKWGHNYLQRAHSSWKSRCSSGLWPSLMYPFTNQKNLKDKKIGSVSVDSVSLPRDDETHKIRITSVSLPRDDETHKILGSSNGLILSLFHPHPQENRFSLCVSNPLTKQSVELPELYSNDDEAAPASPLQINYSDNFLFGIVARRVQQALTYKVVLIRRVPWKDDGTHDAKTSTYIFSSDTGSWATWEQVTCPRDIFFTGEASVSYKAILHWVGFSRSDALITYDPFNSPGTFGRIPLPSNKRILYAIRLPDGSSSCTGAQGMVYSGEQRGLRFVQFTRRNREMPCSHNWKMWRLVGRNQLWRTVPTKCVIPSMPYLCERLLIAPNPFTSDVLCHPFVLDNKLTVFYSKPARDPPVTRKLVDMVLETPEGFRDGGYRNPLILIDFCPWASPSFYIPT